MTSIRSRILVANCPASSRLAVYTPSSHPSRITVKCYDRNSLLSTPKFSLSAPMEAPQGGSAESHTAASTLIDLTFCSPHRLVGCVASHKTLEPSSLLLWDVSRGVALSPQVLLPQPYQIIHIAADASKMDPEDETDADTASQDMRNQLFVLAYHTTTYKLVVFVYHVVSGNTCKLIQKIKVGSIPAEQVYSLTTAAYSTSDTTANTIASSSLPYRSCVLAVCAKYQALVVGIPGHRKIKVMHIPTGRTMGKCKAPSNYLISAQGRILQTHMQFSPDGTLLALYDPNTPTSGTILLWNLTPIYHNIQVAHESDYEDEEDDKDPTNTTPIHTNGKKKSHGPQATFLGIVSPTGSTPHTGPISMEIQHWVSLKQPLALILFTHGHERITRLYAISTHPETSQNMTRNHLTSWTHEPKDSMGILSASFGPTQGQAILVQVPMDDNKNNKNIPQDQERGQAISFSMVSFWNTTTQEVGLSSFQQGDILLSSTTKDKHQDSLKKRKANLMAGTVVIGPGESGGEAYMVSDTIGNDQPIKKPTMETNEETFQIPDIDEGGDVEDAQTIQERLATLASMLDDSEDDSSQDPDRVMGLNPTDSIDHQRPLVRFSAKAATSESLETLLRQALTSNDDSQLEIALQVADKRVIENSIVGLAVNSVEPSDMDLEDDERVHKSSEMVLNLLSKLVTRLARRPTRAEALAYWIRTILFVLISRNDGAQMGEMEREVALKLGPLRNLLNERVECLPSLLKLEGRLTLLSQTNR